jgi:hypothetical protein
MQKGAPAINQQVALASDSALSSHDVRNIPYHVGVAANDASAVHK